MKAFLSWPSARSREAALLLRDWLSKVIHAVEPRMSEVYIQKSSRWFATSSRELSCAIVFLTREELENPGSTSTLARSHRPTWS
jgi:hypothetical protein